ncbi:hypothetical protein U9M48_040552 [Paspalum notatum var. saurae]|uniref:Cupin type-1 domain-containing protein n=1 Tax=Paspalum notatum var. saurae TaxID=547442 RepID=A0AAQ3UQW8_PASNO
MSAAASDADDVVPDELRSTWTHCAWTLAGSVAIVMSLVTTAGLVSASDSVATDSLAVALAAFAGYSLADIITRVYHWSIDNYGDTSTPAQIVAFHDHHVHPSTITRLELSLLLILAPSRTSVSLTYTPQVNGFVCKDPMAVNVDDFFKAAELDKPRDTMKSKVGSNVTLINVMQLPGLNTLGISLARIDYAPLGQNPPHTHPRATEILTVLEGTLYVGFVTSNTDNKLFAKVLNKGDVFVFPQGLIHFQFNPNHDKPAVAIAALSSQNPGAITIANAVFGSKPQISDDVLAKAFQVQKGTIDWLQAHTSLGAQIVAFHDHHIHPSTITRLEPCNNLHVVAGVVAVALPVADAALSADGFPAAAHAFPCALAACVTLSVQFHAWAHERPSRLPPGVGALQAAGVLVSQSQHAGHHRPPYDSNYCTVSGMWNKVLDRYKVFAAVEKAIYLGTGVQPWAF